MRELSDSAPDRPADGGVGEGCAAEVANLHHLLNPASVAVVGAGRRPGTVGRAILHNIVNGGFSGRVYAVNHRGRHVEGLRCVASVADLPEPVDLAIVAVPAAAVREVAEECGMRGVRSLAVVTAALDTGAGADLLAICRRHGMRLIGPKSFGIAVPGSHLNATLAAAHPAPGTAGVVAQSGAAGVALLHHLSRLGIGVSSFVCVGDKYDVSSNDLLTWWEHDGVTRLAVLYVDSFGNPRKFACAARRTGRTVPVVALHPGRLMAERGPAAPLISREALYRQAGVIAAASIGELLEAVAVLGSQPLPGGDRLAVVSNGGSGVLGPDVYAANGLRLAALAGHTQRRLRHILPPGATVKGPVDTTASVAPAAFRTCLEEVAADKGVDMVLAMGVPTATADIMTAIASAKVSKPLAAVVLTQTEAVRLVPGAGPGKSGAAATDGAAIPSYAYPERAVKALAHAAHYQSWRARQHGPIPELTSLRKADAHAVAGHFLARNRHGGWLSADETMQLLSCYGIPFVATRPVTSEDAAVRVAAEMGGHVALKADFTGPPPRAGSGQLQFDLSAKQDIRRAYRRMADTFGPGRGRVFVQPMISGGVAVRIAVVQDPVFGPVVVLGDGRDSERMPGGRSARLAPLTTTEAADMVHELHAVPMLQGQRGEPAADAAALADTLVRVSLLAEDLPQIAELELNPFVACEEGVNAVDARVRITPADPQDPFLRRLR
ncbi:MAG: acetate--CoA ligase family protein [Micromonosporaceae bacterium]